MMLFTANSNSVQFREHNLVLYATLLIPVPPVGAKTTALVLFNDLPALHGLLLYEPVCAVN